MANRTALLCGLLTFVSWLPLHWTLDDQPEDPVSENVATPERVLSGMDWLAGSWSGDMWGGEFQAFYSTPAGGKVLSHSKLLQNGKPVFYEFEVFEAFGDAVVLRPFPGGERADDLTLNELDRKTRKATFENAKKDYPTRITYQRIADDALQIVLSDPHGGSKKTETFDLKRVKTED